MLIDAFFLFWSICLKKINDYERIMIIIIDYINDDDDEFYHKLIYSIRKNWVNEWMNTNTQWIPGNGMGTNGVKNYWNWNKNSLEIFSDSLDYCSIVKSSIVMWDNFLETFTAPNGNENKTKKRKWN